MIPVELARRLRAAGLRWDPVRGDRFVITDRDMDGEVFVLSDMTIEVHEFPTGPVLGFNGTVEWALDSVDREMALWLPAEGQLRERLGGAFRGLARVEGGYAVALEVGGVRRAVEADDAETAYGRALLLLATGEEEAAGAGADPGPVEGSGDG
jgi:hypothetical protein